MKLLLPSLCITLVLLCLSGPFLWSQTAANLIYLHGQSIVPVEVPKSERLTWPQNQCTGGRCYAIIQFEKLPDSAVQQTLSAAGLILHQFIPNRAYLASIPEGASMPQHPSVRATAALQPQHKKTAAPLDWGGHLKDGFVTVYVRPMPGLDLQALAVSLSTRGFQVDKLFSHYLQARGPEGSLPSLLGLPEVLFVEGAAPDPQKEGGAGRASSRINCVNTGSGLGWDGAGVVLGIGDDGAIHHQDFRGRYDDHTLVNNGNHAEMTAGLAVGAGNIDPIGIGMAPGAGLQLFDIGGYPHLCEAPQWLHDYGMVITSTSFAEGCGGYYTLAAQELDDQVYNEPKLLHCFSAGNEGLSSCDNPYSGTASPEGFFWGNITGGRKAGKNHLTVGNVLHTDVIRETSSRGPTADGRIKPDICAMGQGSITPDDYDNYQVSAGTSAAAPQVAGLAAVLYQYYRSAHNGEDPPSALIKAALLNTAEDLGTPGPDYSYGWGRIHAARALEVLQSNQYLSGEIETEMARFHQMLIPAGVSRVKVMVYWHDPAGSPLAAKALVNDLDMRLTNATGQVFLPWSPSPDQLVGGVQLPTTVLPDRLNNVEQVVIEQPNPGYYSIRIHGFQIPEGPQPYYIVYSLEYDELRITFPNAASDALLAGEVVQLRWDALAKPEQTYTLAYSLDSMANWQPIASQIPGTALGYTWTPPAHISSSQVFIRLSRGAQSDYSDGAFVISGVPELEVQRLDDAHARLSWTGVAGATAYEILVLGDQYMEAKDTVPGLSWTFSAVFNQDYWLSVRPLFAGGIGAQRSIARRYYHEGCPLYVNLTLNLGQNPGQLSWRILRANGSIFTSGGPYPEAEAYSELTTSICLPVGCYGLIVSSSGPGGVSNATYQLSQMSGQTIASAPTVGPASMHLFCMSMPGPLLELSQTESANESCTGRRDGWIHLSTTGGNGPCTYQWSHGAVGSQLNGLSAGLYSVTITDGQQIITHSVRLTAPPAMSASIQSSPDYCHNGSISLNPEGGQSPYTFLWADGSTQASRMGLAAGGYGATITDAHGCSLSMAAFVSAGPRLQLSLSGRSPSCAHEEDGSLTAHPSQGLPPYQYSWNTGDQLPTLNELAAGEYRLSLTDARGCSAVADTSLLAPTVLQLQLLSAQSSVQAVATGGTPPYTYTWSQGGTGAELPGLSPGIYSCTLSDQQGCTAVSSVNIYGDVPNTYCTASANSTALEWIKEVKLNAQVSASGSNGGYALFDLVAPFSIQAASSQSMSLKAGFAQQVYAQRWRVYIDYNRDGDFGDSGELVVSAYATAGNMSTNFNTPQQLTPGLSRMRVIMRNGTTPQPCGIFARGEVEDYWVVLHAAPSLMAAPASEPEAADEAAIRSSSAVLYPNPATGQEVFLQLPDMQVSAHCQFELRNAQGQLIQQQVQELVAEHHEPIRLDLGELPPGLYWLSYRIGELRQSLRLVKI